MRSPERGQAAVAVALVLLAHAAAMNDGCAAGDASQTAAAAVAPSAGVIAVRTVAVQPRDLRATFDYVGTVRYHSESKVSARVGGTLAERLVVEGAEVVARQAVARVDVPELRTRLRSVAAEIERAEALARQSCTVSETDGRLASQDALPEAKAEASAASCAAARHAVDAVRAKRDELRLTVGHTRPRATAHSTVLRWLAEPGEAVAPGRPLLLLGAGAKEIEAQVTAADLLRGVRVGQSVLVGTPGADSSEGTVLRIAPMASGAGRHVAVRIALPATLERLPAGAAVDLRFVSGETTGALAVPARALLDSRGARATLFVAEKGRASRRVVRTGISEGGWVAVTPPLAPGAEVITTNLGLLADDAPILAVREPAAGPGGEQ